MQTFKVGDKAVYPGQGVGEVMGIEHKDIAGQRQSFYVLRIMENGMKILIPINKVGSVGLRSLIDEKAVTKVPMVLFRVEPGHVAMGAVQLDPASTADGIHRGDVRLPDVLDRHFQGELVVEQGARGAIEEVQAHGVGAWSAIAVFDHCPVRHRTIAQHPLSLQRQCGQ